MVLLVLGAGIAFTIWGIVCCCKKDDKSMRILGKYLIIAGILISVLVTYSYVCLGDVSGYSMTDEVRKMNSCGRELDSCRGMG